MVDSFKRFVERFFIKKRYIISYNVDSVLSESSVLFSPMVDFDVDAFLLKHDVGERLEGLLRKRKQKISWIFFWLEVDGEVVGYSFLHVPDDEEWNDSLPTKPGEARISSNYVFSKYRGQGVRGEILDQQLNYARTNSFRAWSVVERANKLSLKAEKKRGFVSRENYLIKFLGRNIFSIVNNPFAAAFLIGSRRARR